MTIVNLKSFLFILVFSINTVVSYKSMYVESGELCSPITKRKIKLGKHEDSALIVSQKRLGDHSIKWVHDFNCTFEIDVSSHSDGVFAVIQKLILRKNEVTNECIDYIQFKTDDVSANSRYCGHLNAEISMGKYFTPHLFLNDHSPAGNSYIDPKGKLVVKIFVSREPLLEGEKTDFLILFTSYKSCLWNKVNYLPCLSYQTDKCIYVGFFHDDYVNCPYPGCVDENECSPEGSVSSKKSNGNIVLLSSLSTLAVLFCIFIIGVYLCRKYSKLCWNDQFAAAETSERNANRSVHISGPIPISVGSQSGPYVASSAPTEEDKDLPPSYESLFPNG